MMDAMMKCKQNLLQEIDRLHTRHLSADRVKPDYYEPGKMEYLGQSDGSYDPDTERVMLRFESKGTRYEGRTERIETVPEGAQIILERDPENPYNHNNYILLTAEKQDVGNMPAELCNAIAPLQDAGLLIWEDAKVSFVEPISQRNRHAKQAILFVEVHARLKF